MFPTSSYFKGFNCPFYLSGLCERPYCHYKHGVSDTGFSGTGTVTSGNRGDPRSCPQAHVPERTQASSDYIPAPLPVLDQLRATGVLPKTPLAQYSQSQQPSTSNAPVASVESRATESSGVVKKRPVADAPNILGLDSAEGNGSPTKIPRLQEPQTPLSTITPFDYLKNIIEGKKPAQSVLFASPQDSSTESNSDSNSPVKSRLMPPVEIDYAPSFCHVQPKDGNTKKVNVWDREIDQLENSKTSGKNVSDSKQKNEEQPMDDTDDDDEDSREKGDINEVIKKELEKLKELQRQLDPKSLKELQEHLKPLMTHSSKSDSQTSVAGKDEPRQVTQHPKKEQLVENVNSMKAAFRSSTDEVSSFDLSASFESDDSNNGMATNTTSVTAEASKVNEEQKFSSESNDNNSTSKDKSAEISMKESLKMKSNSLAVGTTIELKQRIKLTEVDSKQERNQEMISKMPVSLASEKLPKDKSSKVKSREGAIDEPNALKPASKSTDKVEKDKVKPSEGKSTLHKSSALADRKLNKVKSSDVKSKENTIQEPIVVSSAPKTSEKTNKEKSKSSEGKSIVQRTEAKTEIKKSSEMKRKENVVSEPNAHKSTKIAVDLTETAESSKARHKGAVCRESNMPKTAVKSNVKQKIESSEVIDLSDEGETEEAFLTQDKKAAVAEENIFQRLAVGTSGATEKYSKPKSIEKANVPSKSDNIFSRLSDLASSCSVYEDNEYVPTFVNPKKHSSSTKFEYNPSTTASSSKMDVHEYVPQFLNVTSAAAASKTQYNPANVVDLTQTPMKDKNRMAIPDSSGEDEDDFSPSVSSSKVTRSREFTGKSSKSRLSSNVSADDDECDFQVKKKKKKKKNKSKTEEIEYVKKVKKIKDKRKKKASSSVDSQGLLQSLFGDTLEDLHEDDKLASPAVELCQPSGSGQPVKPIARPSTSAQSDADVDKRRSASYFDPLKQKWFRSDGSEDVERTAANARASSSTAGENRQSLAASAASSSVVMKKKNGFFPLNAKEVMNQRIQWYEQMKLNAGKKDSKQANVKEKEKEKETNKGASTSQASTAKSSNYQSQGSGVTKAKITGAQRPTMPRQLASKLPLEVRKRYLEVFIDECLRIYDVDTDAYERALSEEQAASDRSSNRTVYLNVVINIRKRLIREQQAVNGLESGDGSRQDRPTISHQAMLGGALAAKGNFGIGLGGSKTLDAAMDTLLAGDEFYDKLQSFCLTEDQLVENGFPIAIGGGNVDIPNADEKVKRSMGKFQNERICARCGVNFKVDEDDGFPVTKDDCYYHWGKLWKRRVAGQGIEQRYTCCNSDTSVTSCQLAPQHVHEANRYSDLSHYKRAPELTSSKSRRSANKGVYSLDCEMVYTSKGSELARVTVVDRHCKVVYEQLVLPQGEIVDCNTRFSGLKITDFDGDDLASLHQVQRDLRRIFNAATILIGHSLESDLIALKMCHEKVIDTSAVFPHKQGLPYKRALKTLASEFLQKIIQSDVGGHDSKEDAVTCMELMRMKVKDDLRKDLRNNRT